VIRSDRGRSLIGIGVAIVLHAIIFTLMAIFGFDPTPYPETEPVFVTLPDYEEPEPAEIAPEPQNEAPAETPGAAQSPTPPASSPVPAPSQGSQTAPPATGGVATAPASTEPLPWQQEPGSDRGGATDEGELFSFADDEAQDEELPDWVLNGQVVQPIDTLAASDQETLAQKSATIPGFDDRLDRLIDSLSNPAGPASVAGPEQTGNENVSRQELPGNSALEWVGAGPRAAIGELTLPQLNASDFRGEVPARVDYIVVFDVNDAGVVVPGSLILRQSSGYTQADQKVRRAVLSWRFDPAPGTPSVTAIATLQITRDEIE